MKRISTALLLLLTLGLAFPAFAQDETEEPTPTEEAAPEGDATEEAAPEGGSADSEIAFPLLVDGDVVEGELDADVTAQLFAFQASEGDSVTVTAGQLDDSGLDTYIVVLGPAGQVLGYDDDSGQEVTLSSELTVDITETGAYLLLVSTYTDILPTGEGTGVEGAYTVTIAGNTAPGADTQFAGGSLELDTPFEDGYSTPEEPVYYFDFEGTEGQTITVDVAANEEFDPALMVFAETGERVAFSDASSDVEESLTVELPADGSYIIWAADRNFINGADAVVGGTFSISVTEG